jgi:small subunit ribosomal protein S8e
MDEYHRPKNKKVNSGTGGRKGKFRDKKLAHIGGAFTATKTAEESSRVPKRGRGGNERPKLKKAAHINVVTDKGTKRTKILGVVESHNPDFVRTNTVTKGAVVETELGKVVVTNRVGQDGQVNGVISS